MHDSQSKFPWISNTSNRVQTLTFSSFSSSVTAPFFVCPKLLEWPDCLNDSRLSVPQVSLELVPIPKEGSVPLHVVHVYIQLTYVHDRTKVSLDVIVHVQ